MHLRSNKLYYYYSQKVVFKVFYNISHKNKQRKRDYVANYETYKLVEKVSLVLLLVFPVDSGHLVRDGSKLPAEKFVDRKVFLLTLDGAVLDDAAT